MGNELRIFEYNGQHQIRTTLIDGAIWFIGKDIAEALGYSNTNDALIRHVDDEDKLTSRITMAGQGRDVIVINESGMYSLILASKLPSAKQFKHWVTHEVLPSIRRSGMYLTDKAADAYANDPELFRQMVERCSALERKVEVMEQRLNREHPYSVFAHVMLGTEGAISFKDGAAFLSQHGIPTGQNRLYRWCRENGLLCRRNGKQWNKPTQAAIDRGLFNVEISGGFNTVTLITPRGLKLLTDELMAEHYPLLALLEQSEMD